MSFYAQLYGLALCALGGVSGAVAAVASKIAGDPTIDQQLRIACWVSLIAVSGQVWMSASVFLDVPN